MKPIKAIRTNRYASISKEVEVIGFFSSTASDRNGCDIETIGMAVYIDAVGRLQYDSLTNFQVIKETK
jgi:hypothetical protein